MLFYMYGSSGLLILSVLFSLRIAPAKKVYKECQESQISQIVVFSTYEVCFASFRLKNHYAFILWNVFLMADFLPQIANPFFKLFKRKSDSKTKVCRRFVIVHEEKDVSQQN